MLVNTNQSKAAEWAKRIDDWKKSGLSLPKFCQQYGLKTSTMSSWIYRPRCRQAIDEVRRIQGVGRENPLRTNTPTTTKQSPVFVPIHLREVVANPTKPLDPVPRAAIEIIVGQGRRVAVEKGFDAETLRRVVAALESGPC
jgi:hypothetical protein